MSLSPLAGTMLVRHPVENATQATGVVAADPAETPASQPSTEGARSAGFGPFASAPHGPWQGRNGGSNRPDAWRWKGAGDKEDPRLESAVSSNLSASAASSSRDPSLVPPSTPDPSSAPPNSIAYNRSETPPVTLDGGLIAMEENLAPTSDPARIVPSSEAGAGAGSSSTSIGFSTAISASTKALLEESASGGVDKATWAFAPGSASLDWCYHAALRETRRFNLLSARGLLDARGVVGVDSGRFGDDGGLGLGAAHEAGLVGLFSRFEQGSLALSIDEFLDRVKGLGRDSGLDEGALTGLSRLVGLLIAGVTAEAVRRRWRMRQLGRVPGEAALIGDGASYFPGLPGLPPRWGLHET